MVSLAAVVVAGLASLALGTSAVGAASAIQADLRADVEIRTAITFRLDAPWTGPPPSRVSILFGLPHGAVTRRGRATFEVADGRLTASHRWRLRGTLLPGAEIEYRFEVRGSEGTLHTSTSSVTYIDRELPWQTQTEGFVEIWWYAGGEGLATDAVNGVRRGLAALDSDFDLQLQRQTRLLLYADDARMRADMGHGTRPWVGGVAAARFNLIVLYASEHDWARRTLASTIAHELTHIAVEHAIGEPPRPVPSWFHEGVATVVEGAVAERFSYDVILAAAVDANKLVSLRGLTGSFPVQGSRAVLAYAQSNSFVSFIIDRWGRPSVTEILDAFREGASQDAALRQTVGVGLDALEQQWLATLGLVATPPTAQSRVPSSALAFVLPLPQP